MRMSGQMLCVAVVLIAASGGWCPAQDADLARLISDLRNGDLEARLEAAWVLAQMGEAAAPAVPALIEALTDQDEGVRLLAATALGEIGAAAAAATEALRRALTDPDGDVRAQAQRALDQIAAASGAQPASTTGPLPASTTGPLPARTPGEPGVPAELLRARGASREELELAIRSLLMQGRTMGLLDEAGNQLNPNLPPDAVSLRPEDVSTHAALIAEGNCRRLADVTDFLAQFGTRLQSTGRTITAEDLLPHLQSYVNWCYENREDPRAGMGLAIAGGAGLVAPPGAAPVLSPDSEISPFGATMLLGDLISTGMGSGWAANLRDLQVLVEAFEEADQARGGDPDLRVRLLKVIVHLFEAANRLAVRLTWADEVSARHALDFSYRAAEARAGSPVQAVLFDGVSQGVALRALVAALPYYTPIRHQQVFRHTVTIGAARRVDGGGPGTGAPGESEARLEPGVTYTVVSAEPTRLTTNGAADPFLVRCTALRAPAVRRLQAEAVLREFDILPFLEEYWPLVNVSDMTLAEARRLLGTWMMRELRPPAATADLYFRCQPGPDFIIADAHGEYRRVAPGRFQVRSVVTVKNAGEAPSDPQGTIEVQLTYADPATGAGVLLPGGKRGVGALAPGETWQVATGWQEIEAPAFPGTATARVFWAPADEQIREADQTNNQMTYQLTDVTAPAQTAEEPFPTPPPVTPTGTAPGLREADLLGRAVVGPEMFINSRVHTTGRQVSGAFWFWDQRPQHRQHGFTRMDIYGSFEGELASLNENYAAEIAQVRERAEGEAVVGSFDLTGTWKAEKWVPRGNEIDTQIVSGQLRVKGHVAEVHNGNYVAHGRVCFFHAGEEEFTWLASAGAWTSELEQARQRMGAQFSMENFPWRIPDTVK